MNELRFTMLLAVAVVNAASTAAAEKPVIEKETAEIIDEVTVLGVRELADLRAEVIKAEDAVYDLYNEFNDNDAYDIICKKETRIGSQIPRRVCLARLIRDAAAEAAEDFVDGDPSGGPTVKTARHNKALRENMAALASKHPELLAALKKRLELDRKFERERDKRFGDSEPADQ